jgi:ZIP family zinc transporter
MEFYVVLILSTIMGLSIFVSYPLVIHGRLSPRTSTYLNGFAIGILIFLIADVFSDAASIMYNGSLYGYGSSFPYDSEFILALIAGFGILYVASRASGKEPEMARLSVLIAVGIGLQNLTEGLVLGSLLFQIGLVGITFVLVLGFTIQNITEGFPIGAPTLGTPDRRRILLAAAFMIGGLPTIIGGAAGYYFSSPSFNLIFDGLAVGAIFYIILPMFRSIFLKAGGTAPGSAYISVFMGFVIGLIVNLV